MTAAAKSPEEALATLLKSASLDPDATSIYIHDLDANRNIISHNADVPVVPASVMKCVTTAALQEVMPYTTSLITNVLTEGSVEKGTLRGNLVVLGCGDPSLADGRHTDHPDFIAMIAAALRERGIKTIEGQIVVDDSRFAAPATPDSWEKADLTQAYGTGCHAFNFAANASGKRAVENPAEIFKTRLTEALQTRGITLSTTAQPAAGGKRELLVKYESPVLGQLMQSCMFRSDNLYAEAFMRLFGVKSGTDGGYKSSAQAAASYWKMKGLPTDGITIADGSGLSRSNRLTATFLGNVLNMMMWDPTYVSFFPLVGEEGTVKNFMKSTPLASYLAVKTGSMNGIQSYAGYLLDEDFVPTHTVVIISNNLKNRSGFRAALSEFLHAVLLPSGGAELSGID